ncbi:hypothetical protein V502_08501 [Pseudogymnoascus sp. VKM F-4520 (FW-2644)]|nr:hypothetical protein V502_08501 [Pseudogymnoascus sp. VKM F-4520 (FW-2644)]
MSSSNWHPATVEEGWESSDQFMETTDEGAESSDQFMETTDEGTESSDQLAETSNDDWGSSDQLSETPNEDLEPTTVPPKYSSVQTVADIETGNSYELRGNMVQGQRVTDLESGRRMPTKPRENWTHKVSRVLTPDNVGCGVGIVVGVAVGVSVAIIGAVLLWDLVALVIKHRTRISD